MTTIVMGIAGSSQASGSNRPFPATPSTIRGNHEHHEHYQVLTRHHDHWHLHATFENRRDAERAERKLDERGIRAKVVRVR
jgi:hypothetical protein